MVPAFSWLIQYPNHVVEAYEGTARPDLALHELQAVCARLLPDILNDSEIKYKIVCNRVIANDREGVQWLLAAPQLFPACYNDTLQGGNALDVAAREGHVDLLCWLATDESAKYWSQTDQQWVHSLASPYTVYAAVEGGNLDVVQELAAWFDHREKAYYEERQKAASGSKRQLDQELKEPYILKKDASITVKAVTGICEAYSNKEPHSQEAWQHGKHFKLLHWLRQRNVRWDVHTMGAAAKAGHLELIQWLADNKAPYDDVAVCIQAIQNPDQDLAIRTLKQLLSLTPPAPWKPKTRGFAGKGPKAQGSSRGEEKAGLCETAAASGKFTVLKWLATAPDGLLPLCEGRFEQRQASRRRDTVDTNIPLTPWEDGNDPGRVRDVASRGLESLTLANAAAAAGWPADRLDEVGHAPWYLNSATVAEKVGDTATAARYRSLAAKKTAEVQEYKNIIAWLDSDESGYQQHVADTTRLLQQTREQLRRATAGAQQQQQEQDCGPGPGAEGAGGEADAVEAADDEVAVAVATELDLQ